MGSASNHDRPNRVPWIQAGVGFPVPLVWGEGAEEEIRWLPSPLLSSHPSRAKRDSGVLQPVVMTDPCVEVGGPRGEV